MTLGIFSAWAKVRSKRYFYGNTFIGEHAFDYHAAPLAHPAGPGHRACALLLGYSLTSGYRARRRVFVWAICCSLVALPWLIKSSLRFTARNTSYRNVRFDFHGTYWGALQGIPALAGARGRITLFTILPFSHRARDYYNINNHSFGQDAFKAEIPVGQLYQIYLMRVCSFWHLPCVGSGCRLPASPKPGGLQPGSSPSWC